MANQTGKVYMTAQMLKKQPKTQFISGVGAIADQYDAFMIDVWGVVHDGVRLNPGSRDCLQQMKAMGKKFIFLSNTPFRSTELLENLMEMGLDAQYCESAMTAGEATWRDLCAYDGQKMFVMGKRYQGLTEGRNIVEDVRQADFILSTLGGSYEGEEDTLYEAMTKALELKLPMICANPDLEVQIGSTIAYCAGHYAQWYDERGGEVHWHGKPYPSVYVEGLKLLGDIDKSRVCAIGDSLRTDMTGAQNFGISGLWNLDGINTHMTEDQAHILLEQKDLSPVAMMKGFAW